MVAVGEVILKVIFYRLMPVCMFMNTSVEVSYGTVAYKLQISLSLQILEIELVRVHSVERNKSVDIFIP